jgi:uncharacterized repeat protein (TIGR01451 family)
MVGRVRGAENGMIRPGRSTLLVLLGLLLAVPIASDRAAVRGGPLRPVQLGPPGPDGEPPLAEEKMPRADAPGGLPAGPSGSGPVDPPEPQVSIKVRVPARTAPGKDLEYRILVENCGKASAHRVYVRAAVPANAELVRAVPEPQQREPELRWELGSLAACGKKEITLTVRPTGADDVRCTARVGYEHGQTVVTQLGKADLQVRLSAPDRVSVKDMKTVTIEVTNLGQAPAANVVVTPKVPEGLAISRTDPPIPPNDPVVWELGTLEPGRSRTVKFDFVAKKTDQFILKVEATSNGGLRKEASATLLVAEPTVPKLSLELTGPERVFVAAPALYQIVVSNPGTMAATNVIVEDVLPDPVQFVSAAPMPQTLPYEGLDAQGKRITGVRLRWPVGTVPPGERRTLQLTLRVAKTDGKFDHRVAARADRGLVADAQRVTQFEGSSGLTVEVDRNPDPVEAGQTALYRIRVRNRGTGGATNVRLDVTLPEKLRLVDSGGPTQGRTEGAVIRFDPLARLAGGEEVAYTISAQALPPGAAKLQQRLRIELTSDQLEPGKPLRTEESVTIVAPPSGG